VLILKFNLKVGGKSLSFKLSLKDKFERYFLLLITEVKVDDKFSTLNFKINL
jgi:hypothetical protein